MRKLPHALGLRYRVNGRPLAELCRTADIAFTRQKVAVPIDGCFWHGCPEHYTRPNANREFWDAKVACNQARDVDTVPVIEEGGWTVLRFWEREGATDVADSIAAALLAGRTRKQMPR